MQISNFKAFWEWFLFEKYEHSASSQFFYFLKKSVFSWEYRELYRIKSWNIIDMMVL